MTRPIEVGEFNQRTREDAEKREQQIVNIEFGSATKMTPDYSRPTGLFKKKKDTQCRVLR